MKAPARAADYVKCQPSTKLNYKRT
ncbi:unnamed protein product, partial [Rotaria sp. Silwood2]